MDILSTETSPEAANQSTTCMMFAKVRALFVYDPATGVLINRVNRGHRGKARAEAGTISRKGYRTVQIDGKFILVHRVIWLYSYGRWPSEEIDHINGDRSDNRLSNLRAASRAENARNTRRPRSNTTGLKGVIRRKENGRWRAQIKTGGKLITLGHYNCPAAAHFSYIVEADRLFGQFARAA